MNFLSLKKEETLAWLVSAFVESAFAMAPESPFREAVDESVV
jgi:hypothetical protein